MELYQIRELAEKHGWKECDHQKNIGMISFLKDESRMNIYYTKMTVATCINHPKKGRTQLFRKNVWSVSLLENLFFNPRLHTRRGYYRKY